MAGGDTYYGLKASLIPHLVIVDVGLVLGPSRPFRGHDSSQNSTQDGPRLSSVQFTEEAQSWSTPVPLSQPHTESTNINTYPCLCPPQLMSSPLVQKTLGEAFSPPQWWQQLHVP